MKIHKWALLVSLFAFPLTAATNIPIADEKETIEKFAELAKQPNTLLFQPPKGWLLGELPSGSRAVKVVVVGPSTTPVRPTLNLAIEDFAGTLKQYLRIVKALCEHHGDEWKDLGLIQTEAGEASLSQADSKTEWGIVRKMHVILQKDGQIYILTAGALKDDFANHYKEFFDAFRSLRFSPTE
jgi:hypothetical protein